MGKYASERFLNSSREEVLQQSVIDEAMITAAHRPTDAEATFDAAMAQAAAHVAPEPKKVLVSDLRVAYFDIASGVTGLLDKREAKWEKRDLSAAQIGKLHAGEFVTTDSKVIWLAELGDYVTRDTITEQRIAAQAATNKARRGEWREFDDKPEPLPLGVRWNKAERARFHDGEGER